MTFFNSGINAIIEKKLPMHPKTEIEKVSRNIFTGLLNIMSDTARFNRSIQIIPKVTSLDTGYSDQVRQTTIIDQPKTALYKEKIKTIDFFGGKCMHSIARNDFRMSFNLEHDQPNYNNRVAALKSIRNKDRYSFTIGNSRLDLTAVGTRDVRTGQQIPGYTYEVELEFVGHDLILQHRADPFSMRKIMRRHLMNWFSICKIVMRLIDTTLGGGQQ